MVKTQPLNRNVTERGKSHLPINVTQVAAECRRIVLMAGDRSGVVGQRHGN